MTESAGTAPVRPALGVIDVVVTCTERKTLVVEPELHAGNIPSSSLPERVQKWTTALQSASGPTKAADALYAGDHWQVARSIAAHHSGGVVVNVWVVSAGYGLVQMDTQMHPYAATFARRHADSVVPPQARFSAADWWHELAHWRPPGLRGPRTLAALSALVEENDARFLLISLSESYASALSADIDAAAARLGDRVGIMSIGSNSDTRSAGPATLVAPTIPGDARLKPVVGGAMQSLNVRLTRRIVQEAQRWFPSFSDLANLTTSWMEAAPPRVAFDRVKLNDEALRQFIEEGLKVNPESAHTALLRALRDSGRACEQARFRALFQEVKDARGAQKTGVGTLGKFVALHDSAQAAQ